MISTVYQGSLVHFYILPVFYLKMVKRLSISILFIMLNHLILITFKTRSEDFFNIIYTFKKDACFILFVHDVLIDNRRITLGTWINIL